MLIVKTFRLVSTEDGTALVAKLRVDADGFTPRDLDGLCKRFTVPKDANLKLKSRGPHIVLTADWDETL